MWSEKRSPPFWLEKKFISRPNFLMEKMFTPYPICPDNGIKWQIHNYWKSEIKWTFVLKLDHCSLQKTTKICANYHLRSFA